VTGRRKVAFQTTLTFIRCRAAYQHALDDRGWLPKITAGGTRMWEQQFVCYRCGALRIDQRANGTRKLLNRWYTLPDGYPSGMTQDEALKILMADNQERAYDEWTQGRAVA